MAQAPAVHSLWGPGTSPSPWSQATPTPGLVGSTRVCPRNLVVDVRETGEESPRDDETADMVQ